MKQYSNKTIQYVAGGTVSSVVVATLLFVMPSISFAAKAAPESGVGGVPYQAPLQPLPQGVGANVSNNIQQTENSGPPDSATTVPPIEAGAGISPEEDALVQNAARAAAGSTSSRTGRMVLWVVVAACLAGSLGWLWFITNKHASK